MDRIIEVKVNGSYVEPDHRKAGVQHEANANHLRIVFDPSWDGVAKTVTFWNALRENPVKRILTADLLEDLLKDTRVYLCPIPGEAMTECGMMSFVIDGWDGPLFVGDRPCLTASFQIEGTDELTLCLADELTEEEHGELVGLKIVVEGASYTITAAGYKGDSEHTILTLDRAFTHPEEGTRVFRPGCKRQRSVWVELEVEEAEFVPEADEPTDPTPTQAEQLQVQIDTILDDMQERAVRAETAAAAAETSESNAAASAQAALTSENFANGYMQDAQMAAEEAELSKQAAAESVVRAASYENFANGHMQDAQLAAEEAARAASTAAQAAAEEAAKSTAETVEADMEGYVNAAQEAQAAAEKARDEAEQAVGGDFATRTELEQAQPLVVTFRAGEADMEADKTLADIAEAHNDGKVVMGNCPAIGVHGLPLTGINGNMAVFSHAGNNMGTYETYTFVVMADGTVDVMNDTFPTTAEMQTALNNVGGVIVTVTNSSPDKTMGDILTAYESGKTVLMKSGSSFYPLVRAYESSGTCYAFFAYLHSNSTTPSAAELVTYRLQGASANKGTLASFTEYPLMKGGGTMTGNLTLNGDPTQAMHAATKQYVDNNASSATVHTAAIGTNWTEDSTTGVKSQTVAISGITADHTAKVDCVFAGDKTSDGYAAFVEQQNQYLEFITNGYAETVEGGITFCIFGDPNTVSIPIVVEVV